MQDEATAAIPSRSVLGRFFSRLARVVKGNRSEPSYYLLTRNIFIRSFALIYLIAFVSLWSQVNGLIGARGILPAGHTMEAVANQMNAAAIKLDRYHLFPTICWFDQSDRCLNLQCAAGVVLATAVFAGFAPAPCLILLWLIYLSLCAIGREFLGFQWDNLLLEAGFLAIFFTPIGFLPWRNRNFGSNPGAPPSRIVLWLLRWLVFRLMFESGCVKLLSQDETWRNLTALTFHYETQPLPTWIGWYAHQLPVWCHKVFCLLMFGIELAVPFCIFAPRVLRGLAGLMFIAFQAAIFLTGNYCFFNLLTIVLCLTLFDDRAFRAVGRPLCRRFGVPALAGHASGGLSAFSGAISTGDSGAEQWAETTTNSRPTVPDEARLPDDKDTDRLPPLRVAGLLLRSSLALVVLLLTFPQLFHMLGGDSRSRRPVNSVEEWFAPLRTFNSYGLFAVMTRPRYEIIVQGSNDGQTWLDYEFKYKPGNVPGRPSFVAPHQPRLDWQMWFAALGNYRSNPWFVQFCGQLLQNSPEVLALLKNDPFPSAPPHYVHATLYEYHFTDRATRHKTGAWWTRELRGEYLPVISLRPGSAGRPAEGSEKMH